MKRLMIEFNDAVFNCQPKQIDEKARIIYNSMKYIKQRGVEIWLR